jgi:hypothetical protein
MSNAHVLETCCQYAKGAIPGLAIMITGKWGTGKSWFVRNKIIPAISQQKKKCLYISLNGKTSREEVLKSIADAAWSVFIGEKRAQPVRSLWSKLLSSMINACKKNDHWMFGFLETVSDLYSEHMLTTFIEAQKPLLIFDDYERKSFSDQEALGLINSFIETSKTPVLIICNIDYHEGSVSREEDAATFRIIKEKYIGVILNITPEAECYLDSKLSLLNGRDVVDQSTSFLIHHRPLLGSIAMGLVPDLNFRSLGLALDLFKLLDETLIDICASEHFELDSSRIKEGREWLLRLILASTCLSRQNGCSVKVVLDALSPMRMLSKEDAARDGLDSQFICRVFFDDKISFKNIDVQLIEGLIEKGHIDRERLKSHLEQWSGRELSPDNELFQAINGDGFHYMDNDDFDSKIRRCCERIQSGEINDPKTIREVGRAMLMFAGLSLTGVSSGKIRASLEQGIDLADFQMNHAARASWNAQPTIDEYDEVLKTMLTKRIENLRNRKMQSEAMRIYGGGVFEFIIWACDKSCDYFWDPVFSRIDCERFWGDYIVLNNEKKAIFGPHFGMRLKHAVRTFPNDSPEIAWLRQSIPSIDKIDSGRFTGITKYHHENIKRDIHEVVQTFPPV